MDKMDKNSKINIPTIIAVLIILALLVLMAVIIILQFAPTTGVSDMIESVIEPATP
jgi:hypothetical protein